MQCKLFNRSYNSEINSNHKSKPETFTLPTVTNATITYLHVPQSLTSSRYIEETVDFNFSLVLSLAYLQKLQNSSPSSSFSLGCSVKSLPQSSARRICNLCAQTTTRSTHLYILYRHPQSTRHRSHTRGISKTRIIHRGQIIYTYTHNPPYSIHMVHIHIEGEDLQARKRVTPRLIGINT